MKRYFLHVSYSSRFVWSGLKKSRKHPQILPCRNIYECVRQVAFYTHKTTPNAIVTELKEETQTTSRITLILQIFMFCVTPHTLNVSPSKFADSEKLLTTKSTQHLGICVRCCCEVDQVSPVMLVLLQFVYKRRYISVETCAGLYYVFG